jgi:hypothetical protein
MKIQILSHGIKFTPDVSGRWNHLQREFKKLGHEVDNIMRKDWIKTYHRYRKFKPDVFISTGIIGALPPILRKIRMIKVPIVHDWNDDHTMVMGKKHGPTKIALLEYYAISKHKHITTPCKFLEHRCRIFGKDVTYIPHGVDEWFVKKEKYDFGTDRIKVIYTGSMTGYEQTNNLIYAVRGLKCDLFLIGKASEELIKNSPKNAHFLGVKKHKEIPKYVNSADICVITSDDDCSLKMYEFLKLGKPILAFKGRIGYLLTHGKNVYLTLDYRKDLKKLIKNDDLRKKLSKGAKKFNISF